MKFDTSNIDQNALIKHLNDAYGLSIVSIAFTPKGEEAFCYVARDHNGGDYFLQAQERDRARDLEAVYAVVVALHDRWGLSQALAPLRTAIGNLTSLFGQYTIATLPYVGGATAFEAGITDEQLGQAARTMARLHGSDPHRLPQMPGERFDNPFEPAILRALDAVTVLPASASMHHRRLRSLLLDQQGDIRATLDQMRRMGLVARILNAPLVPTHGDPNLANFLIDEAGNLHLTDWGEVALGPRERDLTFFAEDRFETYLESYLDDSEQLLLHASLFRFYMYRWVMQEIADYTTRILFDSPEPEHAEYAWGELQPYLPIPHADVESGMQEISAVLRRFCKNGRLAFDSR
jgi:thiamine kinase-like enzyme